MTMLRPAIPVPSAPWIDQVFSARTVQHGGVVRRSLRWVEAEVGRREFEAEVRRRGWHLAECNGQLVVFCTQRPIRILF
ncbi:N-(5'-phosphoribosyl)anthranilate isomerase [Roseicyclus sp.]|uniref:N-(5'-phosphoribosyl)anthranilate isomerase n=1 Tax=Roseicyclus sp. TaxID=1914329 RepID=UPI003FA08B5A